MTTILARKKNGKKCQSVTGFKNVEGVLSKHLKVGFHFHFLWVHERRRRRKTIWNLCFKSEIEHVLLSKDSMVRKTDDSWKSFAIRQSFFSNKKGTLQIPSPLHYVHSGWKLRTNVSFEKKSFEKYSPNHNIFQEKLYHRDLTNFLDEIFSIFKFENNSSNYDAFIQFR